MVYLSFTDLLEFIACMAVLSASSMSHPIFFATNCLLLLLLNILSVDDVMDVKDVRSS